MSRAAYDLHIRGTPHSAFCGHPGLVPGQYLAGLGTETTIAAAELGTAGLRERIDGGYRVLDREAVQVCVDHVRELRAQDNQAPAREQEHHTCTSRPAQGFRGCPASEVTVTGRTRFGEPIGQAAAASFRCAACGEMAGAVKVARAGTTVDMGPPLGRQTHDRDAIVVDYFLGTASRFADAATLDAVQKVVSSDAPDPVALRRIDPELAPFYCPECGLNYCHGDWETFPLFDEGFYDCTIGICPSGHRHTVDD